MTLSKKAKTTLLAVAIPLALTVAAYFAHRLPAVHGVEAKTLDARFKYARHGMKASPQVVVLLIDEASLQSMHPLVGRWPWPRALQGELVDFLASAGAKGVLFDILFTEPQVPRNAAGELGESDQALVVASASSGITHHAFQILVDVEDEVNKHLINNPLPKDFVENFAIKGVRASAPLPANNNFYIPFDEIYQNTAAMGVVEFSPDDDGVYRSTHFLRPYQGSFFPVLPLSGWLKAVKTPEKIEWLPKELRLGELRIPLLMNGRYLINMKREITNYSVGGVFATIQKLNQGVTEGLIVDPADFKDKIIIIGASAVGVDDLKLTPTGLSVPGVYLHASALSNLIDGDFITQFPAHWSFAILACFNVALGLLLLLGHQVAWSMALFGVGLVMNMGLAYWLFDLHRVWLLVFAPTAAMALNVLALFVAKTLTEGKEKAFLKAAFGNYISPELIERMYESGEAPKLGGDVGERTAYFTDIQGFSTFSEKLSAPRLVELLNEYLTVMTDILIAEQGTLDKYEGDAIIAFFGAPMPLPDHAERAVRTALKMQAALGDLRKKWTSEGDKWPQIVHDMRMRIGINSGEIVTGNMGSKMRMNYTMMGDAVNLAARLEESAKQYGVFIQIAQFAHAHVRDKFVFRELDTVRVVGKTEPVTTYEPLCAVDADEPLLKELAEVFAQGLAAYKAQRWEEAMALFERSAALELKRFPNLAHKPNPSKIYLERCEEFRQTPPIPGWDGVYNLTHK